MADYATNQLKHLPDKSITDIKEQLINANKPVVISEKKYWRSNTSDNPRKRTDSNLSTRETDFQNLLNGNIYCKIPLAYLVSLGLVNFAYQIDTRFIFTLETNLNWLFENDAKQSIPDTPEAQIIYHDPPYISYPQITLSDNFLAYYNGVLRATGALRTGVLFSPYQQSFELNTGVQSLNVDFKGMNAEIEWLESSVIFDKCDQHLTIYNSYGAELAAKSIKKQH